MNCIIILVTIIFSIFSTAVMSYISMATPIGPWIAPMLVLFATIIFKVCANKTNTTSIALVTAGGSVGGILATAFGFSFPTLYFLNPTLFNSWLTHPVYFVSILTSLALASGGLGFLIANMLEEKFIVHQELPFPIGQLVYKMIAAQNQIKKAWELMIGFGGTIIFCFLQGGIFAFKGLFPKSVMVINRVNFGYINFPRIQIRFDILPMLLAIGFITGHVIALPLAVGALSRIVIMDPLNALLFSSIGYYDFVLAFCSGIVVMGAILSFLAAPQMLRQGIKTLKKLKGFGNGVGQGLTKSISIGEIIITGIILIGFLWYFQFSILGILFTIFATYAAAYQITVIAGKTGLALLGRFATFVMVPAIFLFGLNFVQITIVATMVEVCGGVATDILFGRKMARLAAISSKQIKLVQLLGLVISSLSIGIIFWLLATHFGLGSDELFCQRSQARALLVNIRSFNEIAFYYILILGGLFGFILKKIKINPMLVLGGLLMPLSYSLGLIAGGMLTFVVKDREEWEPFWSGVFAANSIWELLKTIM